MPARRLSIRALFVIALLCSFSGGEMYAQSAPVPPGTRVRVWTGLTERGNPTGPVAKGQIAAWSSDSLILQTGQREIQVIAVRSLTRLDMSAGRRNRVSGLLSGIAFGVLIGGGAGAVAGSVAGDNIGSFALAGTGGAGGALLGAGLGYLVGAAIGAVRPGERWERVD